jgi:hypothetical protein
MNLVIVLIAAAVVAVAIGVYVLMAARRQTVAVPVSAPFDEADGIVSEPVPIERAGVSIERAGVPIEHRDARADERLGDLESEFGPVEPLSAGGPEDVPPVVAPAPEPVAETQRDATPVELCWAKRFAPRNGALDDSTRLGLIHDLGLVRAPWGVPLLVQAYDEEPDAAHRRAVLAALALYRHIDARAVFERALRSDDENERAIAGAALADLGVTPSLSS